MVQEAFNQVINQLIQKYMVVDNEAVMNSPLAKLSMQELKVIVYLGTFKSDTMSNIAKKLALPHSTLTNIADRLQKKGYLKRESSPTDRRSYLLVLTNVGGELFAMEQQKYLPLSIAMSSSLTKSEQDILLLLLKRVIEG